jgi:hypothetical protein
VGGADCRTPGAMVTLSSALLPQCASTTPLNGGPRKRRRDTAPVREHSKPGAARVGFADCGLQQNGPDPSLSASGVALARIGVHVAVARWRKVHRPLLAVGGNTVPRHVPRCSECMQATAHPLPDPPLSELFHCVRTLGQVNTTDGQQSSDCEARLEAVNPAGTLSARLEPRMVPRVTSPLLR